MKVWRWLLAVCVVGAVAVCGPPQGQGLDPTVILVSFDGFRWDYRDKAETPNLDRLASEGARAEALIPVFPTKTFPNHYSIATGLHPEDHGIVANNMYDPEMKSKFGLSDRQAVGDGRWWGGEPIWVTLGKQGKKSAAMFWPGSEAEILGRRPTYWLKFDSEMGYADRVQRVLDWLELPRPDRPVFVSLYFSATDTAGHDHGPDSPEVAEAVALLDRTMGRLMEGLDQRGLLDSVNLIVVSDHGMAATDPSRVVFLDDCINIARANVVDWNPVAAMRPPDSEVEPILARLRGCSPHLQVYAKRETPERLHYREHPRIPPVIAIADEGWTITSRASFRRWQGEVAPGNHGYDNNLPSMWGVFFARGPAFRAGASVKSLSAVDVYPLMAEILSIQPAPNDGDPAAYRDLLNPPSP